jgi:NCAIR mutase (PurE)-related protein
MGGRQVDRDAVRELLAAVRSGRLTEREALEKLSVLGTEDLGFARLDRHRELRRGLPEVVFGEGKTEEQVTSIVDALIAADQPVLVTRLGETVGKRLASRHEQARYDPVSRTLVRASPEREQSRVDGLLVMSAGTADLPVAEEAAVTAESLGLSVEKVYDVGVAGIHRLFGEITRLRQAKVVIVVAGMEGALPSVVAGLVRSPVIGVPTSVGYGAAFSGLTALFGMLSSCAGGLTVVNIDNGFGAACAAHAILVSGEER